MFSYIWPMALIIICNTVYQICAKSTPDINPMLSLTVTYGVGAIASLILYFLIDRGETSMIQEYSKLNWAPFVLGLVIVGLEAGWIYVYRAGWPVSTAFITQSAVLAFFLILVGVLLYKETINFQKIIGILICMIGLYFINK